MVAAADVVLAAQIVLVAQAGVVLEALTIVAEPPEPPILAGAEAVGKQVFLADQA